MSTCLLCQIREANKKNSHIFPKFFTKRLFSNDEKKSMLAIYKDGRQSRIQKIPKEDYIFCDLCEKRFAILETYCSNNFLNIFHAKELKCKFPLKNEVRENASQQYRECECLDPNMFKPKELLLQEIDDAILNAY